MGRAAGEVALDPRLETGTILGMDPVEPRLGCLIDARIPVAERLYPARRVVNAVGDEIPIPQAVVGSAGRQLVALLTASQRLRPGRHDLFEVVRVIAEPVME